jgi:eukaryotic-like serine/threonine-protein kinase
LRAWPHSTDTLAPGQRIGPFVLLAPMGSGGSGRIWAVARLGQLGFNKRMVLKVMRQDKLSNPRARERFDREACLGARLSHSNLRAVHDLGTHEGRPYMALSWVDTSLEELLEHAPDRRLSADMVCWIGMQCCAALAAAHDFVDGAGQPRPIVHRDVSPGNILLSSDGHALLSDLAAVVNETEASPRAEGSRFFGSLGYAAPEALKQQALDARADLFSLGCVLHEALAGKPAFEGDDEHNVVFEILERGAPDLKRRVPEAPDALVKVVERCLERRPEHRFQTAGELAAALSACCEKRSAFQLEQHAARVIQQVLGAPIREREEALHQAFQRFAPSAFERTDTLPLVRLGAGLGSTLSLESGLRPRASAEGDVSRSGAGVAISDRAPVHRKPLWLGLLLLGLVLASFYGLSTTQTPPGVAASGGPPAEQTNPPTNPGPVLAAPASSASAEATPGPRTERPANDPSGSPSPVASPSPGGEEPSVVAHALKPEPAPPAGRESPPPSVEPRPRRPASPAPSTAPAGALARRPFQFRFDGNPYEDPHLKRGVAAASPGNGAVESSPAPPATAPAAPANGKASAAPAPEVAATPSGATAPKSPDQN